MPSTPVESIDGKIPSDHRKIKQFRNEFIQKWADDARHIYAQNHRIHSSNIYSKQMTSVDFKKEDRHRQKSTHHRHHSLSSSSLLENSNTLSSSLFNELHKNKSKVQLSNSTVGLSSTVKNQYTMKHRNTSSNNSAMVYLERKKSDDRIQCKIS